MDTYTLRGNVQARLLDRTGLVGRSIDGRFRVKALLARGATGRVYLAEQEGLGRQVAVKVLDLEAELASGLDFARRFEREAETLARLKHPNTVRVIDYGIWEGFTWLAMEYVEGQTLHATLAEVGLGPERVVHVLREVCAALSEAHALGVVHRDLKPSNILLTGPGLSRVKLVDFGLVKDLREAGERTEVGALLGSPRYMAPEQVREELVDWRADVYALGVILYRCLVGMAPFEGVEPLAIMYAHLHTPPPPIQLEAVPPCLRWTVARCLEKDLEDRIQDVDELAHALELCAEVLAGTRPWDTELTLEYGGVSVVESEGPTRRLLRRRFVQAGLLAAALLMGFLLGRGPSEPVPVEEPEALAAERLSESPVELPTATELQDTAADYLRSLQEHRPTKGVRAASRGMPLMAPVRAVVEVERGIVPVTRTVPEVDLEPGSPWGGEPAATLEGRPEDPWATGTDGAD